MKHHLIFEGAELAGKTWLMSQIYNYLQPKYKQSQYIMDGCHWFNADNGVFGTKNSSEVINGYLKIFKALKNSNLIVEKFFLADKIYHNLYNNKDKDFSLLERELQKLNFKIILIIFPEDKNILEKRIQDRLNIYPQYESILRDSDWYIAQQKIYKQEIKKITLPYLEVNTNILPDDNLVKDIIKWIEK